MRLKFKQGGTDAVIAVTNVHYCKHKASADSTATILSKNC